MSYQLINPLGSTQPRWHEYTNLTFTPHIHENFEIIYVSEGELKIIFDNKTEIAQKGDFVFLLSYQLHSYETEEFSKCFMCSFDINYVYSFYNSTKNKSCTQNIFVTDEITKKYILQGFSRLENTNSFEKKALFYCICSEFLKSTTIIPKEDSSNDLLLTNIIDYISKNYTDEDLSLKKLAVVMNYEEHYISRYFSKQININFRDFINRYRIDYAKHLLHNTDDKISTIAFECGFRTIRTFNRAFKKVTGMEPNEYKDKIDEL